MPRSTACKARFPPIRPRPTTPNSLDAVCIVVLLSVLAGRLEWANNGSGGCPVRFVDLDGQTDQLILAWFEALEVEPFDDPYPGFEQSMVDRVAVRLIAADGQIVDAHEADP